MANFLRVTKRRDGSKYLQIYDSYYSREEGKNKNRSVRALGKLSSLMKEGETEEEALRRISAEVRSAKPKPEGKIDDSDGILDIGYFLLESVRKRMDIDRKVDLLYFDRRNRFSMAKLLFDLSFARVIEPCSKQQTYNRFFPSMYGLTPVTKDQMYAGLPQLGEYYEDIIDVINEGIAGIKRKRKLDHTFFYYTNFYFEIDAPVDFKKPGLSKEHHPEPIVGMGLLLDSECIPLSMCLYPGSFSEKPHLPKHVGDMRKRQKMTERTVVVADKGLNCIGNIMEDIGEGNGYIFSKSLKNSKDCENSWVFEDGGWTEVKDEEGNLIYKYKENRIMAEYTYVCEDGKLVKVQLPEKRIATYSPALAKKQWAEIFRLIEKAEKDMAGSVRKKKFGADAKYTRIDVVNTKTGEVENDRKVIVGTSDEKMAKDLGLAGYNMLITSEMEMTAREIYDTYHTLWNIEKAFRLMKTQFDVMPVYASLADSIMGHLLTCYLGVTLTRIVEKWMFKDRYSPEEIINFIRRFRIIKWHEGTYRNLIRKSDCVLGEELEKYFGMNVMDRYFTEGELTKFLSMPYRASSRTE